jgi:hypothetical protein
LVKKYAFFSLNFNPLLFLRVCAQNPKGRRVIMKLSLLICPFLLLFIGSAFADITIANNCSNGKVYVSPAEGELMSVVRMGQGEVTQVATNADTKGLYEVYFMSSSDTRQAFGSLGAQICKVADGGSVTFTSSNTGSYAPCSCRGQGY